MHRELSSDAPRLQKQQNITSLLPQIKGTGSEKEGREKGGEGGASVYKKLRNSSTAPNPHQAHSPEDWEDWETSVTVKVPVAGRAGEERKESDMVHG